MRWRSSGIVLGVLLFYPSWVARGVKARPPLSSASVSGSSDRAGSSSRGRTCARRCGSITTSDAKGAHERIGIRAREIASASLPPDEGGGSPRGHERYGGAPHRNASMNSCWVMISSSLVARMWTIPLTSSISTTCNLP
jgi:hypothetical protein